MSTRSIDEILAEIRESLNDEAYEGEEDFDYLYKDCPFVDDPNQSINDLFECVALLYQHELHISNYDQLVLNHHDKMYAYYYSKHIHACFTEDEQ